MERLGAEGGEIMPESEVIRDNHFDEQVDISDAESVPDNRDESDVSDAEDNHAARRGDLR